MVILFNPKQLLTADLPIFDIHCVSFLYILSLIAGVFFLFICVILSPLLLLHMIYSRKKIRMWFRSLLLLCWFYAIIFYDIMLWNTTVTRLHTVCVQIGRLFQNQVGRLSQNACGKAKPNARNWWFSHCWMGQTPVFFFVCLSLYSYFCQLVLIHFILFCAEYYFLLYLLQWP